MASRRFGMTMFVLEFGWAEFIILDVCADLVKERLVLAVPQFEIS